MKLSINTEFDSQLLDIEFFKKMPQMIPWIGSSYGKYGKRVLFVGESCYLNEECTVHLNSSNWYQNSNIFLSEEEILWSNKRQALYDNFDNNNIWKNPAEIMREKGIRPNDPRGNIYVNFAVCNFFLRPAIMGNSLIEDELDVEVANKVFKDVINIIKPDLIVFLSCKSWYNCDDEMLLGFNHCFVPHPSRPWWNRLSQKYEYEGSGPLTGAQKFIKIVECKILQ